MRYGREYGLGNSSSRSWVWAHFAVGAKHDALRVLRIALPRPRDRGLAKRSGPTATPAFEPAFEFSRALAALSSSSVLELPPAAAQVGEYQNMISLRHSTGCDLLQLSFNSRRVGSSVGEKQ